MNNNLMTKKMDFREINKKKWMLLNKMQQLVWTDNDIAQNLMMPFTKRQLQIIDYAITEVKKQNIKNENDKLKISFIDIIRFLGKQKNGQILKDIEKDVLYITSLHCWWRYDENDARNKVAFSFFEKAHELENTDKTTFTLQFNQEFLDKLFNEKTKKIINVNGKNEIIGFNNYEIWNTRNLKSKYGILIYKKCRSWLDTGWFRYSLEDMKKDFFPFDFIENKEKKEKTFGYINNNCIKVGIEDINKHSDIKINKNDVEMYDEHGEKNEKKVNYIIIRFHIKNEEKINEITNDLYDDINTTIEKEKEKEHNDFINKGVIREEKNIEKRKEKRLKKEAEKFLEKENEEQIKQIEKDAKEEGFENVYEYLENKHKKEIENIEKGIESFDESPIPENIKNDDLAKLNELSKEEILKLYLEQVEKNRK